MFKVSGSMRPIRDKELLQSLWEAYLEMEKVKMALVPTTFSNRFEAMCSGEIFARHLHEAIAAKIMKKFDTRHFPRHCI